MRHIPWVQLESGNLKSWTKCEITPNQARGHVVIAVTLFLLVVACLFFFSSVPCPLAVVMVFQVGINRTHSVSVEEIRVFQACVVVNTKTGGMF